MEVVVCLSARYKLHTMLSYSALQLLHELFPKNGQLQSFCRYQFCSTRTRIGFSISFLVPMVYVNSAQDPMDLTMFTVRKKRSELVYLTCSAQSSRQNRSRTNVCFCALEKKQQSPSMQNFTNLLSPLILKQPFSLFL